jgi:hypothetical protein
MCRPIPFEILLALWEVSIFEPRKLTTSSKHLCKINALSLSNRRKLNRLFYYIFLCKCYIYSVRFFKICYFSMKNWRQKSGKNGITTAYR